MCEKDILKTNKYLRTKLIAWKHDSLDKYHNRCVLSKQKGGLEVHHLTKSFLEIVDEAHIELNLKHSYLISGYTRDELHLLYKLVVQKHYIYGFGVPLATRLHTKFHNTYGYEHNTPEQFRKFKRQYRKMKREYQ